MAVNEDRTSLLMRIKDEFAKREILKMKLTSEEAAEKAFTHDDSGFLELSLVAYSLAKLSEKTYLVSSPEWKPFRKIMSETLEMASRYSQEKKADAARQAIHDALNEIDSLTTTFGRFVHSTIEKARVKAATEMYAHGASLGKAVELSGAQKADVASYIGATKIPDKYQTLSVQERLANARAVFK